MARILVVDDDPGVADAIDRTLKNGGHETIVVHNGWDALRAARTQEPDLVILDVVMPGMDGIQVCQEMRADHHLQHIPIIFLTARAMLEDKVEGFEAGADDYLTKPFAIQELGLRVRALLRRAQARTVGAETLDSEPVERTPTRGFANLQERGTLVVGSLQLNRQTFEATTPEHTTLLTPIEFELLNHLMEHVGEVFSSDRLLQEVWEYPPGTGDPALVRMHVRNLRAKIEPEDAAEPVYIRTVSRRGYTVRPN
jgi:DNA-binding response OmpR family regulator